ncbi:RNAse III [Micromonospora pallida]|uniref:Ribonuclease 3 n=1 Tax=Micromonospora pallida TaxID=145854 RepID=A0A1C6SX84_9ACTN|nr:RNAse III [Micromonospora pallida]
MSNNKRRRAPVGHLEAAFGVSLDPELLERALTHRSYAYENGGLPTNERLEFLGDSVLGVVITTALFRNHPDLPEGQLAKLRASVVNMRALAEVARGLGPEGLGQYLLLGKGEETTGGRDKASILADTLEALLGAIYLQYGLDIAAEVIHRLFDPLMAESAGRGAALDWKTSLQELTAALGLGVPEYRIEGTGPDHLKTFTAWVVVAGNRYGGAEGRSKKEAEQRAAESAWRTLSEQAETDAATAATSDADAGAPAAAAVDGAAHIDGAGAAGVDGAAPAEVAPVTVAEVVVVDSAGASDDRVAADVAADRSPESGRA